MNSRQSEALKKHNDQLRKRLEPSVKSLLTELLAKHVISQTEREEIDAINTSRDKFTNLLFKLESKENGLSALLVFLREQDSKAFADTLANDADENGESPNARERTLWEVPIRNRFFTGRETLINQLLKSFEQQPSNLQHIQTKSKITALSACHGLGGVGKTQLAIEFVHRYQGNFHDVFWFPAEDCTQIEIAYKQLAKEFNIDTLQPIDDIVHEIKAWFAAHPGCLLIYDNASSSDVIGKYMPKSECRVLITSRHTGKWYIIGKEVAVDVFEANEAANYIKKILLVEAENQQPVQELAKRLGHVPLALAQACAFIREKQVSISSYLCLYEKEKERLITDDSLPKNEHEPVFITWNITIKTIREASLFSANLLNICSYFHSDHIPQFLLQSFTENVKVNPDKQCYEDACEIIEKYSMIKVNRKKYYTVSLHRTVQEVIRLQLEKNNNETLFSLALSAVLEECPHGYSLEDYEKQTLFIPQLERILHHLNQRLEHSYSFKEKILDLLGQTYLKLGYYAESRNKLTEALVIQEKHFDLDKPGVARTLVNLSNAYGGLRHYNKQRDYLERALVILEKHYGSDHLEVAKIYVNLSNTYCSLEDYNKQREYLERAQVIEEKHYGSDHPEVAKIFCNLGNAYGSIGDYMKQREYLERALAILEKQYGLDHPDLAKTLCSLGNEYGSLGDYNKQRAYLERALVILEEYYGLDHLDVAKTLDSLGNAYARLGDFTKQRECLEHALAILEKHYGSDHPEVARILVSLSHAPHSLGEYNTPREYLKRAFVILTKNYASVRPEVARTLISLSNACERFPELKIKQPKSLKCALKIFEKYYGSEHVEVANTLASLSNAYGSLLDFNKMRKYRDDALIILEKHSSSDRPEVARTFIIISNGHEKMGEHNDQKKYLERALVIFKEHYGSDHPEVARTLVSLSNAYERLGYITTKRECLESALVIFQKHYGSDHSEISRTAENLSDTVQNIARYNQS